MSENGNERRGEERYVVYWPANFIKKDRSKWSGKTINVSQNGLNIATNATLKKGEEILVNLDAYFFGKKHQLQMICEVVHFTFKPNGELGVGLSVISKRDDYRKVIEEYGAGNS